MKTIKLLSHMTGDDTRRYFALANIGGIRTCMLMLDTGATHTVLDTQNVRRWDLPFHGVDSLKVAGDTVIPMQKTVLSEFYVGTVLVKDFPILVGDIFGPNEVLVAGVLGMDFFNRFKSWTITQDSIVLEE